MLLELIAVAFPSECDVPPLLWDKDRTKEQKNKKGIHVRYKQAPG
jgi:hypothetical protein